MLLDSHPVDPVYVGARRVLLDALEALGSHRKAVVLVGAQAIYERVGTGHLLVAPYTSDGDLALNPSILEDEPLLAAAFASAGFSLAVKPGTWVRDDVQIDLMVPAALGGSSGRRSAQLGLHGTEVARKAKGLEAALVDYDVFTLTALDDTDTRRIDVAIAGLSALLVAKLHKLAERELAPARQSPKDGLDVLRILQGGDLDTLGATLAVLEQHAIAGVVTSEARSHLRRLFGSSSGHGATMAVRATVGVEEADTIAAACVALTNELLRAWETTQSGG
jgi:hypothetical protein